MIANERAAEYGKLGVMLAVSLSAVSGVPAGPLEEAFFAAVSAAGGAGSPEVSWGEDRAKRKCPVVTVSVAGFDFDFDSSGDFGWVIRGIARDPEVLLFYPETIVRAYASVGARKGIREAAVEQGQDQGLPLASYIEIAWAAKLLPKLFDELDHAGHASVTSRLARAREELSQAWDFGKSVAAEDRVEFDRRIARGARPGE